MTAGLAVVRATAILNIYRGTAYSAVSGFVQLYTGDPGAAGTANASVVTTRNAIAFAAPSTGSTVTMALSTLSSYTMTATESIQYVGLWSASSGGVFQESWPLGSAVAVINGSTLTFSAFTLSYTPIAA